MVNAYLQVSVPTLNNIDIPILILSIPPRPAHPHKYSPTRDWHRLPVTPIPGALSLTSASQCPVTVGHGVLDTRRYNLSQRHSPPRRRARRPGSGRSGCGPCPAARASADASPAGHRRRTRAAGRAVHTTVSTPAGGAV